MVSILPLQLRIVVWVLITTSSIASPPAVAVVESSVPIPTAPAGSQSVFVAATDPAIIWSSSWGTASSSCSPGTVRTASGTSSGAYFAS
ncbi:hypothetical protein DFH09DRAFT_144831 [Mycena vulgaris]|nr:hypothetical protein DFH09DRAFT_144831 [Mycena vulgaris]